MTDTLWSDVSEFQGYANDSYPYPFIAFRSNDGTFRDNKFAHNLAWAKSAVARGKLLGFIVYFVYEPNWQETVATFKAMIGAPHPKMAVMIDVESWGRIRGNNSPQINASRENIIAWLGGNRKRVIGYGNVGDLNSLWPQKGDTKLIVAAYGSNPGYPNKLGHQFADNWNTPPFGPCDINSADGYTPQAFAAALGLVAPTPAPKPPAPPAPKPPIPAPGPTPPVQPPVAAKGPDMFMISIDPKTIPAGTPNPGIHLVGANLHVKHVLSPGSTNVVAYQHAGVPGPVVITYQEFLSYLNDLPPAPAKVEAFVAVEAPEVATLADELVPAENEPTV